MTTVQKTQSAPKAAAKAAPKAAPKIVSTNDAAKAAAKAAPKAAPKAATAAPQSLTAAIVTGIAARIEKGSAYYARALQYHAKAGTVFPRARNNETRAALKAEDVAQVFDMHDKKILAAGNAKGQAMFDVYMMSR